MLKEEKEHLISIKKYINQEDFEKIRELETLCHIHDGANLKLELEYKLLRKSMNIKSLDEINEFFYYISGKLVGYLGICSFGRGIAEINGMVHPDYRRRGIFKRLYDLGIFECGRRNFKGILLLSDNKSNSGNDFIKFTKSKYAFSECNMHLSEESSGKSSCTINLRKALNSDAMEISRQNKIYFGLEDSTIVFPEDEEINNQTTYMIELKGKVIGKIRVTLETESAFISGFGIVPEYRGQGFGRETLSAVIHMLRENNIRDISLDVETRNMNALNLYKSCGFEARSIMNYYEVI